MSVSSPAITIDPRETNRSVDVRAQLLRLHFRRRLWRACARVLLAVACLLALCCAAAFLDYLWPVRRVWRIAFASTIWFAASLAAAHTVWNLIKKRTLVEIARDIEQAAGSKQNALVTFAELMQKQMAIAAAATITTDATATGATDSPQSHSFGQSYLFARLRTHTQSELHAMNRIFVQPRSDFQRHAAMLCFALVLLLALRFAAPLAFARETKRVLLFSPDDDVARQVGKEGEAAAGDDGNDPNAAVVMDECRVRVLPPSYSGLSAQDVSNSYAPIRVLKSSQIEITLHARGAGVEKAFINYAGAKNAMRALEANRFVGTFNAAASGAFETGIITQDETRAPAPFVRAVEVYADAVPEARLTEPASDQLLRRVPDRPVVVRWTARDDLGLQNISLHFIKSRGEGDAAKFTSGEISAGQTTRPDAREWRGQTALDLARLDMQAGDTLVFWIEARDRNPFANNTGRSASLSIAVKGAEVFKLDLSDLRPSEVGRFLLSERLILMHTEKLHNERPRLAQNEFTRRANIVAAEQREFKNSFNDYINIEGAAGEDAHGNTSSGGNGVATIAAEAAGQEVSSVEAQAQAAADERTEIHNHGIPEPPPGSPASVNEMTLAINAMWNAEDALSASDTAKALGFEREALTKLKRAQAAVRYVPPVLPRSKPLDLKRRYAGELAEIKTQLEKLASRSAPKEAALVRLALADAYNALADLQSTLGVPIVGRASALARARDKSSAAANRLVSLGGDHAATIAEAAGQLRIVETELRLFETSGASEDFAARLSKPLALLAQAASNLYAIAEQSTHGSSGVDAGASAFAPSDDARADEYFRRLMRRRMP
jgi:hypothetical protein